MNKNIHILLAGENDIKKKKIMKYAHHMSQNAFICAKMNEFANLCKDHRGSQIWHTFMFVVSIRFINYIKSLIIIDLRQRVIKKRSKIFSNNRFNHILIDLTDSHSYTVSSVYPCYSKKNNSLLSLCTFLSK